MHAIVIQPVGRRPRGKLRNRREDDIIPKWYNEIGIPMTEVNNCMGEGHKSDYRHIYKFDADDNGV